MITLIQSRFIFSYKDMDFGASVQGQQVFKVNGFQPFLEMGDRKL